MVASRSSSVSKIQYKSFGLRRAWRLPRVQRFFELHPARGFQQNYVSVTRILSKPLACSLGCRHEFTANSSITRARDHLFRQASHADQNINALLGDVATGFAMHFLTSRSQFEH